MVRKRQVAAQKSSPAGSSSDTTADGKTSAETVASPGSWSSSGQWILYAVASGACAAFNGVFAKLTTTELTSSLSNMIADTFGLSSMKQYVEIVVRVLFFILNLSFNGVMWSLFTTALARGTSTTQVSIMNTSTNFVVTALLGFVIFSEALPPLWWAGAALLVAGNVVIGSKDEGDKKETVTEDSGGDDENDDSSPLTVA
ncbi:hypothetical protein BGZ63DRAFT_422501 [Mariannaea sp. PMI_226]|nr:hypothetical protein BGZ63DRAFT_422501 [Mariannaea sp. PMI_226]